MASIAILPGSALESCGREDLPRFFSLQFNRSTPSGLSPIINVRNSIRLACQLVQEAIDSGIIGAGSTEVEPGRLLIVGGGPAGIAAAMMASRHGIGVRVLERRKLCSLFCGCFSRWLDPFVYDWPDDSWRELSVSQSADNPLEWSAGWADGLALHWIEQFEEERRAHRFIELECPCEKLASFAVRARTVGYGPSEHQAHFLQVVDPDPSNPVYAMYLACPGGESEDCRGGGHSPFDGYGFWQNDRLGSINLNSNGAMTRVLVSGGGDGGCQDFLRIVCSEPKMRTLADAFWSEVVAAGLESEWQRQVVGPLRDAEDLAPDREKQHATCEAILANISPDLLKALHGAVRGLVHFDSAKHELIFAYRKEFLTAQYALNRFGVLLFARWLRDEHGISVLRPNKQLEDVQSGTHSCDTGPDCCLGKDHQVKFSPRDENLEAIPFQVIVIRHGLRRQLTKL